MISRIFLDSQSSWQLKKVQDNYLLDNFHCDSCIQFNLVPLNLLIKLGLDRNHYTQNICALPPGRVIICQEQTLTNEALTNVNGTFIIFLQLSLSHLTKYFPWGWLEGLVQGIGVQGRGGGVKCDTKALLVQSNKLNLDQV